MLTQSARGGSFAAYLAAYKLGLNACLIRGRHKYYNLIARYIRQISCLSAENLAWLEHNLTVLIAESNTRPLKDEAIEIHVVQKLKAALQETKEESAIRAGNRLEAVTAATESLRQQAFGAARTDRERAGDLSRRLRDDPRVADAMFGVLERRLLPAVLAQLEELAQIRRLEKLTSGGLWCWHHSCGAPPQSSECEPVGVAETPAARLAELKAARDEAPLYNVISDPPVPLNKKAVELIPYLDATLKERRVLDAH